MQKLCKANLLTSRPLSAHEHKICTPLRVYIQSFVGKSRKINIKRFQGLAMARFQGFISDFELYS